jgi:hypothetical protein
MKNIDDDIKQIRTRFEKIECTLDERMMRSFATAEAVALGRGGDTNVAQATGVLRRVIHVGLTELVAEKLPVETPEKRIWKTGGGRNSIIEAESGVMTAQEKLIEINTMLIFVLFSKI